LNVGDPRLFVVKEAEEKRGRGEEESSDDGTFILFSPFLLFTAAGDGWAETFKRSNV